MGERLAKLRAAIDADPERRARVERLTREMTALLAIHRGDVEFEDLESWTTWLRDECGVTYEELVELYVNELHIGAAIASRLSDE